MLSILTARKIIASFICLSLVAAVPRPRCNAHLFGYPTVTDCLSHLAAFQNGIDNKAHFFALPSVTRRPQSRSYKWDTSTYEWRNKIPLPVLLEHQGHPLNCIAGVFPIELTDRTLSWDIDWFFTFADVGHHVVRTCLRQGDSQDVPYGPGGRVSAGHNKRLAVILYEPGSEWDFQVQAAQAQNRPIYVPLNAAGPMVAGSPGEVVSTAISTAGATATAAATAGHTFEPEASVNPEPYEGAYRPDPFRPEGQGESWGAGYGTEGQGPSRE
ncbi:hypothetical protein MMC17_010244 [Xylographa soralifera]|nr:hypothetical protein [Xylographa soralifera]